MRVLLVSLGSGSRGGGEIYLLRLAREFASRRHDVHLLCIDQRRMDELVEQFAPLGQVNRVRVVSTYDLLTHLLGALLDYRLQKSFVAALRMSGLDVFTMASRFEGFPLALLECLCLGLPSCVSNVGGMPEAVTHGVNGYLCPPDDPKCWADCLTQLIVDPELRRSMGRSAYALGQAKFSLRRMTDETEAVYAQVMADARRSNGCSWE